MKLIHQGGLHNHGNNDAHTCPVPIETRSRLNLTTYFYPPPPPPNLNEIDDITINNYAKIQLHDIGNL